MYGVKGFTPAELAVIVITLFVLIISALDAHRLAFTNLLGASPTVSCTIKSGKNYYDLNEASPEEREELIFDMRVIVQNLTRFSTSAYVNMNFKVYGESVEYSEKYAGKELWQLDPYGPLIGRIPLRTVLNKANPSKTIEQMINERTSENSRTQLTMKVEVENEGNLKYIIKNFPQEWCFDFERREWLNTENDYYA